jgi:hypothetical protein
MMQRKVDEIDERSDLLLYVIAASFEKMNHRITSRLVSKRYYECLSKELPPFPFKESASDSPIDNDKPFIKIIPILVRRVKTKIPNLQHVASLPWPFHIYNENTYMEFHLLLIELLGLFKNSLNDLKVLQDQRKDNKMPFDVTKILKTLGMVLVYGRYLRTMAISSAIEAHFKAISFLLEVDEERSWPELMTNEEDADDLELRDLMPSFSLRKGKPLYPWESYRDWLRLMVHYFDATRVLASYCEKLSLRRTDSDESDNILNIPITILSLPRSEKVLLPWTELLQTERFFPTSGDQSPAKDYIKTLESIYESCNLDDITSKKLWFYKSLKDGSLRRGGKSIGEYHCEAYIASLLVLLDHPKYVPDQNMLPDDFNKMKALLDELKVSNAFMHRLILVKFNDRVRSIPSECLNDAARCALTYSIC